MADKGYDSDEIRDEVRAMGIVPVILRRSSRVKPNAEFEKFVYKTPHSIENLFAKLKRYRSISNRFEKLARNFRVTVYLACSMIWIKSGNRINVVR